MTDVLFLKEGTDYYFYQNDHLGTPQKMTSVNGAVAWTATYTSFGEATIDASSTVTNNLRLPGQYYDQETGLHYNWHRYYEPTAGRYLTTDLIGLRGGDVNVYAYVLNNPLNRNDPSGLFTVGGPANPRLNTIVCDGAGGIKVQIGTYFSKCLLDCVIEHEESHKADVLRSNPTICVGRPENTSIKYSNKNEQKFSEIKACNVEINCLKKKLECPDECETIIRLRIKQVEEFRDSFK